MASPTPKEPCARRTIFAAFRQSAVELWGRDGLRQLGERMPEEARRDTVDTVVVAHEWLPETYVLAWYEAAWEGPAARDNTAYFRFLDRMMDHGFGKVRKFMLSIAGTPHFVASKGSELWRHDHTHGTLTYREDGPHGGLFTLSDHPYIETPLSRASIAEIYRYAAALTRVKEVKENHSLEGNALTVRITWR